MRSRLSGARIAGEEILLIAIFMRADTRIMTPQMIGSVLTEKGKVND